MTQLKGFRCLFPATLLFMQWACGDAPPSAIFIEEEISTTFLRTETLATLRLVQEAKQKLPDNPGEAIQVLDEAEASLQHITSYYHPLLDAKERTYNAYGLYARGDSARATGELDLIEKGLLSVAEGADESIAAEIKQPMEALADVRVAMTGTQVEAAASFETLARRLNAMLVKGRLIIR